MTSYHNMLPWDPGIYIKVTLIQCWVFIQTIIMAEIDISMFKLCWISIEMLMNLKHTWVKTGTLNYLFVADNHKIMQASMHNAKGCSPVSELRRTCHWKHLVSSVQFSNSTSWTGNNCDMLCGLNEKKIRLFPSSCRAHSRQTCLEVSPVPEGLN